MALTLLGLLIVAGVVFKGMSAEERQRAMRVAMALIQELRAAARTPPREQPFREALKSRSPKVVVLPVLLALNVGVFVLGILGVGPFADPQGLVNIGPRTTNGEWWRLVTAVLVQHGLGQLLIVTAALFQLGSILERLAGRPAFAGMYLIGGLLGGLVQLSAHAATAGHGGSAAVGGLFGMLAAFVAWGRFHPDAAIPLVTIKRLAPVTLLFGIHTLWIGAGGEVLLAVSVGVMLGVALLLGAMDPRPQPKRLGAVVAAALVGVVAAGIPLRGIADVWPDLTTIVATEDRMAKDFEAADRKFRNRKMTAEALAGYIESSYLPDLRAQQARIKAIRKVPQEHQVYIDAAEQYLELRVESWRYRAAGLRQIELRSLNDNPGQEPSAVVRRKAEAQHRANLATLGNAEGKARASLHALEAVRAALK